MKKLNYLLMLTIAMVTLFSCQESEPCDGSCPTGTECVGNQCIAIDPCVGVTCPTGQQCVDGTCKDIVFETVNVTGNITSNTTWTADKIYVLNGKVYVTNGVTLTIQPGTIIKGGEGANTLASALVIARGAKILAEGTAEKPIIFTTVVDGIKPGQINSTLTKTDLGKWGGLIVLGKAPVSAANGDVETQIEGIPGDVVEGKFGGSDPADNSGIIKYVSVRFGGAVIGDNNEINGITLGGVGSGTVIENIEIVANKDDGLEIFGGTVNVKNVIVAYQDDDAIDLDMNYSGTIDNFYVIHGGSGTDEALEIDGPEGSTNVNGLFILKNGTCIAADQTVTSGADLKAKAQGTIENVSWAGYKDGKFISVAAGFNADCSEKSDAWTNAKNGKLIVKNCEIISGSLNNASIANLYTASATANCLTAEMQSALDTAVSTFGNKVSAAATIGANKTVFNAWTWAALNNEIK
ncbi:MAG: hypothetical protein KDC49_02670 [Saprospiraceae bacterium]|nr:hypothetical protein [Saprospiraceae bacterium]